MKIKIGDIQLPPGPAPDIQIGEVTTVPHGEPASATVRGTTPNLILDLELPDGAPGEDGTDGSNVLPTNEAIAQAVTQDGPAKTALSAAIGEVVEASATIVRAETLAWEDASIFLGAAQLEVAAGVNEVQTVTITGTPTGGTFTLSFDGKVTAAIPYNATASDVQTALRALANIGGSDVTVTGGPGPGAAFTVTFAGNLAAKNVPSLVAVASLTGGSTPGVTIATSVVGGPEYSKINNGSQYLTVWKLPKGGASSLTATIPSLPRQTTGVRVRVHLTGTSDASASSACLRIIGGQLLPGTTLSGSQFSDNVVLVPLPVANSVQSKVLEAYLPVDDPTKPLLIRLIREVTQTLYDTWGGDISVYGVEVTPVGAPQATSVVSPAAGYKAWPFLLSNGTALVCAYTKRAQHDQPDTTSGVFARRSTDGGVTWGAESTIRQTPGTDEASVGKGYDAAGNMLIGVREGTAWYVYKSTDGGQSFTLLSTTTMGSDVNQVSDIFVVPTVGLMAFFHAGSYSVGTSDKSWGYVKSSDGGATWAATTVESGLSVDNWPTEISGAYIGSSGRIFAIGRSEKGTATAVEDSFFQLTSTNYGATWSRNRTNITDTKKSTPSVIWNGSKASIYWFRRDWGDLRRRVVDPNTVWGAPRSYPDSEIIALGGRSVQDDGNVNATAHGDKHLVAFYSGTATDTAILLARTAPPA